MDADARVDDQPFEEPIASAQLDAVRATLVRTPSRVLDLGCGAGRLLVPLAAAGHDVVGLDRSVDAIALARASLARAGADARLEIADLTEPWPDGIGTFDVILCLGNTFMTIVDVDRAVAALDRMRRGLEPGGLILLDDLPRLHWPEVTEGYWHSGLADGQQLVWHPTDAVFAVRAGDEVDPDDWTLRPSDVRCRLWTDGGLAIAARQAGLSAPDRSRGEYVLMLRASPDPEGTGEEAGR